MDPQQMMELLLKEIRTNQEKRRPIERPTKNKLRPTEKPKTEDQSLSLTAAEDGASGIIIK
jgi:hypothetical protein